MKWVALVLAIALLASGCGAAPVDEGKSDNSALPAGLPTVGTVDASNGQALDNDTPFGSPPQWVLQTSGTWSINQMNGTATEMTEGTTGCRLIMDQHEPVANDLTDARASQRNMDVMLLRIREQFGSAEVVDRGSARLVTAPKSKDPDTSIEFLRYRVDYQHATAPRDWSVVLLTRVFATDGVTLSVGYSCPRGKMRPDAEVDRLLASVAKINVE